MAASQRLGQAAVLAMLRVARTCPGALLDSTWFGYALPLVRAHPAPLGLGPAVDVDTSGPVDIAELAATMTQMLGAKQVL